MELSDTRTEAADPEREPQQLDATGPSEPQPRQKRQRIVDPQKREALAQREKVRRLGKKLAEARNLEELSEMLRAAGIIEPPRPPPEAEPEAKADEKTEELAAGQVPGFPSKEATAAQIQTALAIWGGAAEKFKGTRYDFSKPMKFKFDGEEITVDKVQLLADGTAPLLAKYNAAAITSPEAAFVAALATVFLMPALGHAWEKIGAMLEEAEQQKGEG